jgi:hypothetical protein
MRSDDRQDERQCSSPWVSPSRLPSYTAKNSREGELQTLRDSFAASLWRNSPLLHAK